MNCTGDEFRKKQRKIVTLMGMSGCGKTTLARKLPKSTWFHYSADYRIGTRYLDEPIMDNIKEMTMQIGFLRDLLRSDSIYIESAMTFDNLDLLSKYVGKLGNPEQGGLHLAEFKKRQRLHREAEINAMRDTKEFIRKAKAIYGYDHFVNDSSGSLCELDDERVLKLLAQNTVMLFLDISEEFESEVIQRQIEHPKPLFYEEKFLDDRLSKYLQENNFASSDEIDPDEFVRWIFPQLMKSRYPKYASIAKRYGYSVMLEDMVEVRDEQDFVDVVCMALDAS